MNNRLGFVIERIWRSVIMWWWQVEFMRNNLLMAVRVSHFRYTIDLVWMIHFLHDTFGKIIETQLRKLSKSSPSQVPKIHDCRFKHKVNESMNCFFNAHSKVIFHSISFQIIWEKSNYNPPKIFRSFGDSFFSWNIERESERLKEREESGRTFDPGLRRKVNLFKKVGRF